MGITKLNCANPIIHGSIFFLQLDSKYRLITSAGLASQYHSIVRKAFELYFPFAPSREFRYTSGVLPSVPTQRLHTFIKQPQLCLHTRQRPVAAAHLMRFHHRQIV